MTPWSAEGRGCQRAGQLLSGRLHSGIGERRQLPGIARACSQRPQDTLGADAAQVAYNARQLNADLFEKRFRCVDLPHPGAARLIFLACQQTPQTLLAVGYVAQHKFVGHQTSHYSWTDIPADSAPAAPINGGAIIDHEAPRERRFVAVEK
jgi:hypothetical protein